MNLFTLIALTVPVAGLAATGSDHSGDCCQTPALPSSPMVLLENANPPAPGVVTGSASGRIVFEGELVQLEELSIVAEKAKGCVSSGSVDAMNRSLLVEDAGGIANVVVTVSMQGAEVKVPDQPIRLDQTGCRFSPHVIVVPAGAQVAFSNSDSVSHNVHTYPGKNDAMNKTIAAGSKEVIALPKADRIEIKCDIHPWMNSWLIVADTPYMAVTDASGAFEIAGLPAGDYEAQVWHEKLGKSSIEFTIAEDGSSPAMELKMGAVKKKSRRRR